MPFMPVGAHVAVVDPGVGTGSTGRHRDAARRLPGRAGQRAAAARGRAARRRDARARAGEPAVPAADRQHLLPRSRRLRAGRRASRARRAAGVHGPCSRSAIAGACSTGLNRRLDGLLRTSVVYLDTFGNVKLSALGGHLVNAFANLAPGERLWVRIDDGGAPRDVGLLMGPPPSATWRPDSALLYDDSYGRLCICREPGPGCMSVGHPRGRRGARHARSGAAADGAGSGPIWRRGTGWGRRARGTGRGKCACWGRRAERAGWARWARCAGRTRRAELWGSDASLDPAGSDAGRWHYGRSRPAADRAAGRSAGRSAGRAPRQGRHRRDAHPQQPGTTQQELARRWDAS